MEQTNKSLLLRAQAGEETAWNRIVTLYEPMIRGWFLRNCISQEDASDLTQDVLAKLIKELHRFSHVGQVGAFRGWLRTITVNQAREFWRAGKYRPKAAGGSEFLVMVEQLEDPESQLSRQWNEQHDQYLLRQLLAIVEREFGAQTVRAFHRLTFDGAGAEEVAQELEMSIAAVYAAKSRVLARLRREGEGLLE